jgi:putative transcriptional regulator
MKLSAVRRCRIIIAHARRRASVPHHRLSKEHERQFECGGIGEVPRTRRSDQSKSQSTHAYTKPTLDEGRMPMAKRNLAKEIEAGLNAILADLDGRGPELKRHFVPTPNVGEIRRQMGLSQAEFSNRFGLNRRTLQDWEQDRRQPDQLAAVLLHVIKEEPAAVVRVMHKLRSGAKAPVPPFRKPASGRGASPLTRGAGKKAANAEPKRTRGVRMSTHGRG